MLSRSPEARKAYRLANRDKILKQQAESRERCREETRKKDAARRETNREKIRVADRAAYAANPERKKAYSRARNLEKKEEIREYNRLRNAANPEPGIQRSIQWQKDNRERRNARERERHKLHPEMHRTRNARRRARKLGLPDTFTTDQEAFMLSYWHNTCAVCGNQEGFFWQLVADHFVPLSSPECPGTVASNMIPLCDGQGGCNTSKKNKDMQTWLLTKVNSQKAGRILQAIAVYFAEVHRRFPTITTSAAD